MKQIQVLKYDTLVYVGITSIKQHSIKAKILAIMIGPNYTISYQVVWYDSGGRHTEWIPETEVKPASPHQSQSIGFIR